MVSPLLGFSFAGRDDRLTDRRRPWERLRERLRDRPLLLPLLLLLLPLLLLEDRLRRLVGRLRFLVRLGDVCDSLRAILRISSLEKKRK